MPKKYKRTIPSGQPLPEGRIKAGGDTGGPEVSDHLLFDVLRVLEQLREETGKSVSQIALNWLLQRPGVSNIVIGARNEKQLKENLGATGWTLMPQQIARLDAVSGQKLIYPHWVGAR